MYKKKFKKGRKIISVIDFINTVYLRKEFIFYKEKPYHYGHAVGLYQQLVVL